MVGAEVSVELSKSILTSFDVALNTYDYKIMSIWLKKTSMCPMV